MKQLIEEQLSQFEKQAEKYMTDLHAYYHSQWNGTDEEKEVYRIEAEKLGWKEIEEEFIQNFLVYFQDQRLEDPTIGVENGNTGIDALIVNDQIQKRAMNKANRVLNFFKPYFQEKMHEEAVEELECYCSDDRASGYYSNGHFSSCPQYPKAQKIITCHLCKRSYTKDLTVNNFTPLTQFCSECGQGFVDNNPKE